MHRLQIPSEWFPSIGAFRSVRLMAGCVMNGRGLLAAESGPWLEALTGLSLPLSPAADDPTDDSRGYSCL